MSFVLTEVKLVQLVSPWLLSSLLSFVPPSKWSWLGYSLPLQLIPLLRPLLPSAPTCSDKQSAALSNFFAAAAAAAAVVCNVNNLASLKPSLCAVPLLCIAGCRLGSWWVVFTHEGFCFCNHPAQVYSILLTSLVRNPIRVDSSA